MGGHGARQPGPCLHCHGQGVLWRGEGEVAVRGMLPGMAPPVERSATGLPAIPAALRSVHRTAPRAPPPRPAAARDRPAIGPHGGKQKPAESAAFRRRHHAVPRGRSRRAPHAGRNPRVRSRVGVQPQPTKDPGSPHTAFPGGKIRGSAGPSAGGASKVPGHAVRATPLQGGSVATRGELHEITSEGLGEARRPVGHGQDSDG